MRITDVLRGQIDSRAEAIAGCTAVFATGGGGKRGLEILLERSIRHHLRTTEPLLERLEQRLGPSGLVAVLRIGRGVIERDLARLEEVGEASFDESLRRLGAEFVDHSMLLLHLGLAVAELCLTEVEILELGDRWAEEHGIARLDVASDGTQRRASRGAGRGR